MLPQLNSSHAIQFEQDIGKTTIRGNLTNELLTGLVAAPAPTTSTIVASNNTGLIVPAYHSLQGATDSLYLDFNGHFDSVWGSYSNVDTPAYDIDGNPGAFSTTELDRIQQIWAQVAEDYAPFNIDVTTVEPAIFENGVPCVSQLAAMARGWAAHTAESPTWILIPIQLQTRFTCFL